MMRVAALGLFLSAACAKERGASASGYDYIIVGGGAAGAVLANRLTESGQHSVLLLNVAGPPPDAYNGPVLLSDEFIAKRNMTANYGLQLEIRQPGYSPVKAFSVKETGSSPARWLGGSTLVGLSLYLRDHPEVLDEWGEGWSWKDMRQYFHKVESLAQTCYGGNQSCGDYGTSGLYHIAKEPAYTHPLTMDFIAAAQAAGFPKRRDLNTHHGEAVGVPATTQWDDGTKVQAYNTYLNAALGRPNLRVIHGARADRLILHGDRCTGVAYRDIATHKDYTAHAKREVVLSAGYVYTPRILFLSGLGPKKELEEVGIPVLHDLPAVGKHVTSARYSPLSWRTEKLSLSQMVGSPISASQHTPVPDAYQSTAQEALARFRSNLARQKRPREARSDVVLTFLPMYQALRSAPLQFSLQGEPWPLQTNAYTIMVTLGETEADGEITFPTGSPDVSPVLTHKPLTDEDWKLAQEAVEYAMKVGNNSALGGSFIDNGAGRRDAFSAIYDGRGSCRIGRSQHDSVVDSKLRVHGIEHLRIVDGSVIPRPSPYLALPEVLALAERAADLILEKHAREAPGGEMRATAAPGKSPTMDFFSIDRLKKRCGETASLYEMVTYEAEEAQGPLVLEVRPERGFMAAWALVPLACILVLSKARVWKRRAPQSAQRDVDEPLLA